MMIKWLLFLMILTVNGLYSAREVLLDPGTHSLGIREKILKEKKKYNLSICAIFRDETKYLKEWIEYHRLVGVDHFYLYNNGADYLPREILEPFIRKGIVTLIPWNERVFLNESSSGFIWALSTQIPAYENAIHIRGAKDTKWLICLDINEYLVPLKTDRVADILESYSQYSGLILSTDCFDSSKISTQPGKRLIIESRELIALPKENPNQEVTKTICKPDLCKGFFWPPYQCQFKEGQEIVKIDRSELRINRYVYRGRPYLENLKRKLYVDNRLLSNGEVANLLKEGYEIEDQERAIERFLPQLWKKMGL